MSWWRSIVDRFRSPAPRAAEEPKTIAAAKRELESRLMAMPGVVSIGVGRADDGTEVIVLGVDGSQPDLEPQLPKAAGGFPVEIRRIGPLRAT